MAESLVSDGKAVDVVAAAAVTKGDPVVIEGFTGIAMASASSGETLAIEIALREHEITVPGAVSAAKGAVLYITSAGVITATAGSNKAFIKVTRAKNADNVVWGVLLPQS